MIHRPIALPMPLEDIEASVPFRIWAGTQDEVIDAYGIGLMDFDKPGPFVVRAFHGTTHDFDTFASKHFGNPEGAFGTMHYFTSSKSDAEMNYACDGPDLTSRIEQETERLIQDIEEDPEAFELTEDADDDAIRAKAEATCRKKFHGDSPRTLEVFLRFEKPFVINGDPAPRVHQHTPLVFPDIEDSYSRAEELVLQAHCLDHLVGDERSEALEGLQDDVFEQYDALHQETIEKLADAFLKVSNDLEISLPEMPGSLLESIAELTHSQLYRIMNKSENIIYIDCPVTGALISSEFTARVIEELGYDAIVLLNADKTFKGMNIPIGSTHIHIFDKNCKQIKSIENRGTFCARNPNIYM